jgi:hypothetical protein
MFDYTTISMLPKLGSRLSTGTIALIIIAPLAKGKVLSIQAASKNLYSRQRLSLQTSRQLLVQMPYCRPIPLVTLLPTVPPIYNRQLPLRVLLPSAQIQIGLDLKPLILLIYWTTQREVKKKKPTRIPPRIKNLPYRQR